ncbi:MAG: LPS export ABC transporter periplasmic protein LptC [Pseudomonadales bacterium]|nr:LPS export ABC transporter periplasmic protein LptC [Pseudomonadales bacterium]
MIFARRQVRLVSALLLIVAAVVIWSISDNGQSRLANSDLTEAADIDFFIVDADFNAFDSSGQLSQTATSPEVKHFRQTQQSTLLTPLITTFQGSRISATINSQSAVADDNSDTVTFSTNVRVTSYKETAASSFLNTQLLHYNRKNNSIYSEEHVEFTDTLGNITTATGLFSDIQLNTLELITNVKGKFHAK